MSDSSKKALDVWAEEVHEDILTLGYRVKRTLFSGESEFQRIDVVETAGYGRMLFNDGVVMISERDEFVYHEMIAHVPLFVHPQPRRVLVIGGGDGGTVRETLRHPSVEHCRLVEIDPVVVEACRKHIPQTASALDDERAEVTIADGVKFVAETDERYDVVIVDSTDPIGPATPLFDREFYSNVHRVLSTPGLVISQCESPFYEVPWQQTILTILHNLFDRTHLYNYVNLTYPGGLWSFSYASKGDLCPIADLDTNRIAATKTPFQYYNAPIHRAAFVLPEFQRRQLNDLLTPFREEPA